MERDKPCANKKCEHYCNNKHLLHCNGFKDHKFHYIENCTGYIRQEPTLIIDREKSSMVRYGYFVKPEDLNKKVGLMERLKAAFLVFTGKAYAQLWHNEEEIDGKLKYLIDFYKERVAHVDCITTDCEGYDDACNFNCMHNHKIMMMCRIYTPEHRV